MKISQQPTEHILVRAYTGYENDHCDFAIISCGKGWAEEMSKRLDAILLNYNILDFESVHYRDCSADFYVWGEDTGNMLSEGQDWAFVKLEEGEEGKFAVPEYRLDCYRLVLERNYQGQYTAHSEDGSEEYFSMMLPFNEIVKYLNTNT